MKRSLKVLGASAFTAVVALLPAAAHAHVGYGQDWNSSPGWHALGTPVVCHVDWQTQIGIPNARMRAMPGYSSQRVGAIATVTAMPGGTIVRRSIENRGTATQSASWFN